MYPSRTAILVLTGALSACASSAQPSVVTGTVARSSFPSPVTGMVAVDEAGRTVSCAIGADSRFGLALTKGHRYALGVASGRGVVPLVFPRLFGRLDASFVLDTNGAQVVLGDVRFSAAPRKAFRILSSRVARAQPPPDDDRASPCGECVEDEERTWCQDGRAAAERDGSIPGAATGQAEQASEAEGVAVGQRNAPERVEGCESED